MHFHNPQVRVPLCHWINPNSIPPTALPSTDISSAILYSSFLNVYKCISSQFQACWRHVSIHTHSYAITRSHTIVVNKWGKIHSVLPVMLSSHRCGALERECAGLAVLPLRVFTWMLLSPVITAHISSIQYLTLQTPSDSRGAFNLDLSTAGYMSKQIEV